MLQALRTTGCLPCSTADRKSCGIVVNDDGVFTSYKDTGLVNDVFTPEVIKRLGDGNMAVGHARYGTTGNSDRAMLSRSS